MAYMQQYRADPQQFPPVEQNQIEHAAELARLLVRHLGVEGAARTCRENHWDGVLTEVLNQNRTSVTP